MISGRERVLCVDDDGNILEAMRRTMGTTFTLVTALGGPDGLAKFDAEGPFAVVVSDLRMPVVDGVSLLAHVHERSPATSRILLTGHADVEQAIRSINEGHILRFLTKPCAGSLLRAAIQAGIDQHRLVTAEKILQEQTLRGSIRALAEVLMLVHPIVGGQTSRVRRMVVELAEAMALPDVWRIEVAALLANVGFVTLPTATVEKLDAGKVLSPAEEGQIARAPEAAAKLIANIPRMEEVQSGLFYQRTRFDGSESPVPGVKGERIPMAARLLRVATDFDQLTSRGMPSEQAFEVLASRAGYYDPQVLQVLKARHTAPPAAHRVAQLPVRALEPGMVFDDDLRSLEGRVLVGRGSEVTTAMLDRIREYWDETLLSRLVQVRIPPGSDGSARAA